MFYYQYIHEYLHIVKFIIMYLEILYLIHHIAFYLTRLKWIMLPTNLKILTSYVQRICLNYKYKRVHMKLYIKLSDHCGIRHKNDLQWF